MAKEKALAGLPNRIRAHRKARGWTLEHVALEAGVSIPAISDLELGHSPLTQGWMNRLARIFELPPTDFLLPEEQRAPLDPGAAALVEIFGRATPEQRRQILAMATLLVPAAAGRKAA